MVSQNMSYVPRPKNTASSYPADGRDASAALLEGLHGYNAHATVIRLQIHRPRSLFANLLARVGYVTIRERKIAREMDPSWHYISMGTFTGNRNRQRARISQSFEIFRKALPHPTHSNIRIQLARERSSRAIALRSARSTLQGL